MRNSTGAAATESYSMNAGNGSYSYSKNSYLQRAAADISKERIREAIASRLNIARFPPGPFRVADLGCSVGPNTFIAVQNVIEAVQRKYSSSSRRAPDFQVFFNDHAANDFNALFVSLPPERNYYSAGVPGSFHCRLFPESSLHFVYSIYALHWLSGIPVELLDEDSMAWNKGRVQYSGAPKEVVDAFKSQFDRDMEAFFEARAKEIVSGGLMALIMAVIPDGVPHSHAPPGVLFDFLSLSLMDMAEEGIIRESDVDSFNIPIYEPTPKEMKELISANGCFEIERMELTTRWSGIRGSISGQLYTTHVRAVMEGIVSKHFGVDIMDELFSRFMKKTEEFPEKLEWCLSECAQLLVILRRK